MDTNTTSYTPLPGDAFLSGPPATPRRPLKGFAVIFASVIFLMSLVALIINQGPPQQDGHHHKKQSASTASSETTSYSRLPRGIAQGVSAKSNPSFSDEASFNWTNAMFSWQRTAFHFQPERNWMNGRYTHSFYYLSYFSFSFSSTRSQLSSKFNDLFHIFEFLLTNIINGRLDMSPWLTFRIWNNSKYAFGFVSSMFLIIVLYETNQISFHLPTLFFLWLLLSPTSDPDGKFLWKLIIYFFFFFIFTALEFCVTFFRVGNSKLNHLLNLSTRLADQMSQIRIHIKYWLCVRNLLSCGLLLFALSKICDAYSL